MKLHGVESYMPSFLLDFELNGKMVSPFAVCYLMLISLIATRGSKSSSNFNNIFTTLKIIFITFMVTMALTRFNKKNYDGVLQDPEKIDYEGVI